MLLILTKHAASAIISPGEPKFKINLCSCCYLTPAVKTVVFLSYIWKFWVLIQGHDFIIFMSSQTGYNKWNANVVTLNIFLGPFIDLQYNHSYWFYLEYILGIILKFVL